MVFFPVTNGNHFSRRIVASEAILGFAKECKKEELPPDLARDLSNYRNRWIKHDKNKPNDPPLGL